MPIIPGTPIVPSQLDALFAPIEGTDASPAPATVQLAHLDGQSATRLLYWAQGSLGTGLPGHTSSAVAHSSTTTPVTKTALSGTLTLNGSTGWTISATGQALRLRWSVQVRPRWTSPAPWLTTGAQGEVVIKKSGSASHVHTTYNTHCWLVGVQVATNSSLTTWTDLPDQSAMGSTINGETGALLTDCPGVAMVPAWRVYASLADEGEIADDIRVDPQWVQAEGEYVYNPSLSYGPIYGLRIVVHGIYSMRQSSTGAAALVVDTDVGGLAQSCDTDCATLTAEVWSV